MANGMARFDPFRDVAALQDEVERVFGQMSGRGRGASSAGAFSPALDVEETEDGFVLYVELPGVSAENVDVSLEENVLTVSGERSFYDQREAEGFRRIERHFGRFHRAVRLMLFEHPENHFNLVAREGDRRVGIINVRDFCHISLFFVENAYHGRGIGRALFDQALARCYAAEPDLKMVDVNSSLHAVPFYERLGFERIGEPRMRKGIRFVEMKKFLLV